MNANRAWAAYSSTYRAKEMNILASWIRAGVSGAVVGLTGAGKSNLLGFLGHRPDLLREYLPAGFPPDSVALIPVDLNNLPANNLATLYRVILRSFYEVRDHFEPTLAQTITDLYRENRTERDPFLPQSALRELLLRFQHQQRRVVLILDRFDHFCQQVRPPMLDTLRGLRDSFKDTLCYIVGMRQEVAYLSDPDSLGELYEILDSHVCWVGPMNEADAQQLIIQETGGGLLESGGARERGSEGVGETGATFGPLAGAEIKQLLALTGGYPALLKAACHWQLTRPDRPALDEWGAALLAQRSIAYRLAEILAGLTQEEQLILAEVEKRHRQLEQGQATWNGQKAGGLETQYGQALTRLATKGLCRQTTGGWRIFCDLLAAYITNIEGQSSGKIWLDEKTGEFYQDQRRLEGLEPLEQTVLGFLVKHPQVRHTHTDLIENTWPGDQLYREGVSPDSLYQVIRKLRKRIEPNPAKPCYLITWRGVPEGGYQFFPEGRPG